MIAAPSASECDTSVHEIAARIYRANKRIVTPDGPGAFNFNQYVIARDDPLLFHAGPRRMFPRVSEAVVKGRAAARPGAVADWTRTHDVGDFTQRLPIARASSRACATWSLLR